MPREERGNLLLSITSPLILDTDDFIYNWLSIFEELLEFPKFIVFCYEKIWQPGYLENSIECEPMGELIGLI